MQGLLGSWRWLHFPGDTCLGLPSLWPAASTPEPAVQAGDSHGKRDFADVMR